MMVAGAAHKRYIKHTSSALREVAAQRVREVLAMKAPPARVAVPMHLRPRCPNARCHAPLPAGSTFCPRCGTRLAEGQLV